MKRNTEIETKQENIFYFYSTTLAAMQPAIHLLKLNLVFIKIQLWRRLLIPG